MNRIFKIFPQTEWRPSFYICEDNVIMENIQEQDHFHRVRIDGFTAPVKNVARQQQDRKNDDAEKDIVVEIYDPFTGGIVGTQEAGFKKGTYSKVQDECKNGHHDGGVQ